jgi:putative flippase GtrA
VIFQLLVYSGIGFINTIVDYLIFVVLTVAFYFDPVPSNVVSYSIGVTVSFLLNRRFTFRTAYKLKTRHQFARFFAVYFLSARNIHQLRISVFSDPVRAGRQAAIDTDRSNVGIPCRTEVCFCRVAA